MDLPDPWVFAIIGSLLTIGSAVMGWLRTSRLEQIEKEQDQEISKLSTSIEEAQALAAEAIALYNFAQLKQTVAQLFVGDHATAFANQVRESALKTAIDAVLLRQRAAELTEQYQKDWVVKVLNEPNPWSTIGSEWETSLDKYVPRYNNLVEQRRLIGGKLRQTRRSIERNRSVVTTLEILGLLIVLGKDLPQP